MRLLGRLAQHWPTLLACAAALLALLLLWLARATPLQPTPALRLDALSAFFSFVLLAGMALAAVVRPGGSALGWRGLAMIALLLLAWATTLTPIVVVAYLLVALLAVRPPTTDHRTGVQLNAPTTDHGRRTVTWRRSAPTLIAAGALLVGYGALALRGALFYDARSAGAALDGFAFWFVLLAAVIPTTDRRPPTTDRIVEQRTENKEQNTVPDATTDDVGTHSPTHPLTRSPLLQIIWLYPLVRLYSLGPWNSGWSLAALLLGGGATLWAGLAAFARPAERRRLTQMSVLAMALAGFALGTGAGIVAGCYALLAYVVLALPTTDHRRPTTDHRSQNKETGALWANKEQTPNATTMYGGPSVAAPSTSDRGSKIEDRQPTILDPRSSILDPQTRSPAQGEHEVRPYVPVHPFTRSPVHPFTRSPAHWLLSGAIPFTALFVAAWMLVGASVAGGVALLAGVAWLAMLLNSLAAVLAGGSQAHSDRRPLLIAAGASVVLGVGAPLVVLALIQPVVEQLQGGLTPYGDVNIWPWIGLASIDSARAQVTTLPSIAVAALMLVLSALVYLIVRLRDSWAPTDDDAHPAPPLGELLALLRAEVPWLVALGPRPVGEERRVDGE